MHQDHNLQWFQAAANFEYVHENRHTNPPVSGLFPKNLATQRNSLTHFSKVLISTIKEFSETERSKYPPKPTYKSLNDWPLEGDLFPDEFLEDAALDSDEIAEERRNGQGFDFLKKNRSGVYPYCKDGTVDADTQKLEWWIKRIGPPPAEPGQPRVGPAGWAGYEGYSFSQGDLCDTVNALLSANQMAGLLQLAQHPYVPLHRLRMIGCGHSFGWDYFADTALRSYILFNICEAVLPGDKFLKSLKTMYSYKTLVRRITQTGCHSAHATPHLEFFGQNPYRYTSGWELEFNHEPAGLCGEDLGRLKGYLKMCFAHLVRYDMLMRECDQVPHWEEEIALVFRELFCVPVQAWHKDSVDSNEEWAPVFFNTAPGVAKGKAEKRWEEKRDEKRQIKNQAKKNQVKEVGVEEV